MLRKTNKDWLREALGSPSRPRAAPGRQVTPVKPGKGASIPTKIGSRYGKIRDPYTKQVGNYALTDDDITDEELADALGERFEKDPYRRWVIRAIFAFHRNDDETMSRLRKVSIFTILPSKPTPELERRIMLLPHQEREEAIKEVLREWKNIHDGKYFFIEDPPPPGVKLSVINRGTLLKEMMKLWRAHPVNQTGDMEFIYPDGHISVRIKREDLLNRTSRDKFFEHVNRILELMKQGFKYDPRVHLDKGSVEGALRRMGDRGPEPWSRNR